MRVSLLACLLTYAWFQRTNTRLSQQWSPLRSQHWTSPWPTSEHHTKPRGSVPSSRPSSAPHPLAPPTCPRPLHDSAPTNRPPRLGPHGSAPTARLPRLGPHVSAPTVRPPRLGSHGSAPTVRPSRIDPLESDSSDHSPRLGPHRTSPLGRSASLDQRARLGPFRSASLGSKPQTGPLGSALSDRSSRLWPLASALSARPSQIITPSSPVLLDRPPSRWVLSDQPSPDRLTWIGSSSSVHSFAQSVQQKHSSCPSNNASAPHQATLVMF